MPAPSLIQEPAFTLAELQRIAARLDAEERSITSGIGLSTANADTTGNFNGQVLAEALQRRGLALIRCGHKRPLINEILRTSSILVHRRGHWLSFVRQGSVWYDLDSQRRGPVPISEYDMIKHLRARQGNPATCNPRARSQTRSPLDHSLPGVAVQVLPPALSHEPRQPGTLHQDRSFFCAYPAAAAILGEECHEGARQMCVAGDIRGRRVAEAEAG